MKKTASPFKKAAKKAGCSVSVLRKIVSGKIKKPDPKKVKILEDLGILVNPKKSKLNFANWLRRKRLRKGVSLATLATLSKLNASLLSALENGRIETPSESVKAALRAVLNLKGKTYAELLDSFIDELFAFFTLIFDELISTASICDFADEIYHFRTLVPVLITIQNSQSK